MQTSSAALRPPATIAPPAAATAASPGAAARPVHARAPKLDDAASVPGEVRSETLPNGVRLIIAERPGAAATKFQVGIGAGALQDPAGKLGLAHMLEHLAFEGSPTRSAAQQELLRKQFGNNWNAWTNKGEVVFWGIIPAKDAVRGAELVTDMFKNPATTGKRVPQERAAVENEMVFHDGTLVGQGWDIAQRMLYGDGPATNNVIGSRTSVDRITSKDLQDYHRSYYVGRNTVALVDGDPKHLALDTIRRELGKLPAGARVDNSSIQADAVPGPALQVINQGTSGTVSLDVLVPVPRGAVEAAGDAAVDLLKSSLQSRLNDRLRRNDHLTYGVSVSVEQGDATTGHQSLLAVSTNVAANHAKQAAEDIMRTLRDARDGFGPKTFAKDKTELKALLGTREPDAPVTASDVADVTFQLAIENPGIVPLTAADLTGPTRAAQQRALSNLTPEQFNAAAASIVDLDNVKVLATGQLADGGKSVLDGMAAAGIPTGSVDLNPVDLSLYKEMGIGVPRNVTPPVKAAR